MSTDLMPLADGPLTALEVARDPDDVLAEAHRAAAALKRVIDAKPEKIMFGPQGKQKQYLVFEDWQTVGRFYGIAPVVVSDQYVTYGEASGWEATAQAVHVPTGRVVSSANAMCLNDEEKWSGRPKYEWHYVKRSGGTSKDDPGKDELIWEKTAQGRNAPKKERVLAGEERVPLFQLRSMAQTRAAAKALRNALAWVVVLAGYEPTPAEELEAERMPQQQVLTDTLRPGVVVDVTPPIPPAFAETSQDTLEIAPEDQRAILLGRITAAATKKKLTEEQKRALWTEKCGEATKDTADVAALQDLLAAVRAHG